MKCKKMSIVILATALTVGGIWGGKFLQLFGEDSVRTEEDKYHLEFDEVVLTLGNMQKIVLPSDIPEDAELICTSSDDSVAYVKNGVIIAEQLGQVEIDVSAQKGKECWTGTIAVRVRGSEYRILTYPSHGVVLQNHRQIQSLNETVIEVGRTAVLHATVRRGVYHSVRYYVEDQTIADIKRDGVYCYVTAKKPGETIVKAALKLGDKTRWQKIKIRVTEAQIPVENPCDSSEYTEMDEWQGDYVYFGRYEQDNDYANGTEPILWRVLEVNEDSVLLLSDVCLEQRYYNDTYQEVTWEDSTLRKWLNSVFLDKAFNGAERDALQKCTVKTIVERENGTQEEILTEDYAYLLSIEEITNTAYGFYTNPEVGAISRRAYATEYAIVNNGYRHEDSGTCWWLRDNGISLKHSAYVFVAGGITTDYFTGRRNDGVRPLIRLDLSKISFAETEDGRYYIIP